MRKKLAIGISVYIAAMLALGGWFLFSTGFLPSPGFLPSGGQANLWTGITQALLDDSVIAQGETGPNPSNQPGKSPDLPGNTQQPSSGSLIVIPRTGSPSPGNQPGNGTIELTPETILSLANRVSTADRLTVLNIIRKRFSLADIKQILSLVRGGVTPGEKAELIALAKARLSPQDISTVQGLLLKYAT